MREKEIVERENGQMLINCIWEKINCVKRVKRTQTHIKLEGGKHKKLLDDTVHKTQTDRQTQTFFVTISQCLCSRMN